MEKIKKRSVTTKEMARDIIDAYFLETSIDHHQYLPKYKNMIEMVRRIGKEK